MPQLATLRIPLYTFPPRVEVSPLSPFPPGILSRTPATFAARRNVFSSLICHLTSPHLVHFISFHLLSFHFVPFCCLYCSSFIILLFDYEYCDAFHRKTQKKKQPKNKKHGAWLTQSSQGISAEFSKFLQNSFNGRVEDLSFLSMPTASYTDFDFIYYH